jgi:hypothetical protein
MSTTTTHVHTQYETEKVKMEINGKPYYVKSKGNIPYLYDIDTHDEVGYWSSKKGQYIMFSLYNRMMRDKYQHKVEEGITTYSSDGDNGSTTESETTEMGDDSGSESSSSSLREEPLSQEEEEPLSQEEEEEESMVETKNKTNTYSLIFLFLILFVYLTLQNEFRSIYFDFVFLILINLLNTLKVFEMLNDGDE